jgi:short-subunit dehydrogenase
MKSCKGTLAFITGGSSGIGLALSKQLAVSGAGVVIFARDGERLAKAAAEIEAAGACPAGKVGFRKLDVSDHENIMRVMMEEVKKRGVPDLLVNNAGRAHPAPFEKIPFEQFEETMRINLFGVWSACSALVPEMRKRGGAILNVSSIAGFQGVYGFTDYSASKFAVIGFSESLRQELLGTGLSVHVLCPPDTDTPGFRRENMTKPEETKAISAGAGVLTADTVAAAALAGVRKGAFLIVPGFDGRFTLLAKRLAPWLVDFVIDRSIRKVHRAAGRTG